MPDEGARGETPLRLFIAAPAPQAVQSASARWIAPLRGLGDVRWVRAEQLHLTLKFLGAVPAAGVGLITATLDTIAQQKIANNCLRILLTTKGLGAFPDRRHPQTLWLGIDGETDRLTALASEIEAALEPAGFPRERRPYRPHLTVGRVRSERGRAELAKALASTPGDAAPWRMDEFVLMQSVLGSNGSTYTPLRSFRFGVAPRAGE